MRERVDLVGGELDVESKPGHGSVITADLPIVRAEQDDRPDVGIEANRSSD
jgi:signal transduction histidine kinase